METRRCYCYILLALLLLLFVCRSYSTGISVATHVNEEDSQPSKWKLLSSPPSLTLLAYWESIKNYLTTKPTTDFRGDGRGVKGAVEKSMEKTKETIEKTAKSAAEVARETYKSSLTDDQDEL